MPAVRNGKGFVLAPRGRALALAAWRHWPPPGKRPVLLEWLPEDGPQAVFGQFGLARGFEEWDADAIDFRELLVLRSGAGAAAAASEVSEWTEASLAETFEELVQEWKRDAEFESSLQRAFAHRTYQQIIGLGPAAVPLLLRELEREPDYWFWALTAITREDPAQGEQTLESATARWIEWGRARGYA